MLKSEISYFLLPLCLFFISAIQASEALPARFSANAFTGVYTVGHVDLMTSIEGNTQHNLYVNPQATYGSDRQWYGDVGLGYRWIKNDAAIVGWYVFAGHSRVENSSGFWITNPGLEVMGRRWDARINAYIPVAGRSDDLGNFEFDKPDPSFFTGHSERRNVSFSVFNETQHVGNGADARVAYQLFPSVSLKAYVGAYFFDIPHTENVRGGATGMEYWFDDHVRAFVDYSYDNYQRSNVVGGLGISFGGVRNGHWADPSLSERLTDPIERYLANLGHGSGIPSETLLYGIGSGRRIEILRNNIAFFSQTGTPNTGGGSLTLANCTFENPCGPTDFSQAGVDRLNNLLPNTQMYFNGGNYSAINAGLNPRVLNNGQSIYARTTDYSSPATGAARSTFGGALQLEGNNTLENIVLIPVLGGFPDTGLEIEGPNTVIRGSSIGNISNRYEFAVDSFGQNTLIDNTTIFSNSVGVLADESSMVLQNSTVDVSNSGEALAGIAATQSDIAIINSQILVSGTGDGLTFAGLRTNLNSNIAISDSTINVTNSGSGIARALENNSGEIVVENSVLNVNAQTLANAQLVTGNSVIILPGTECVRNGIEGCPS